MPYQSNDTLPGSVKGALPGGAQSLWRSAFNAGHGKFKGDEGRAAAYAWGAIKQGGWQKKKKSGAWTHESADPPKADAVLAQLEETSLYLDYLPAFADGAPSYETVLAAVQRALREHQDEMERDQRNGSSAYSSGSPSSSSMTCRLVATFDDHVIYERDGLLYRCRFEMDGTEAELDGDHEEVASAFVGEPGDDDDDLDEEFDDEDFEDALRGERHEAVDSTTFTPGQRVRFVDKLMGRFRRRRAQT